MSKDRGLHIIRALPGLLLLAILVVLVAWMIVDVTHADGAAAPTYQSQAVTAPADSTLTSRDVTIAPAACCRECAYVARLVGHIHAEVKALQTTLTSRGRRLVAVEKLAKATYKRVRKLEEWRKHHR